MIQYQANNPFELEQFSETGTISERLSIISQQQSQRFSTSKISKEIDRDHQSISYGITWGECRSAKMPRKNYPFIASDIQKQNINTMDSKFANNTQQNYFQTLSHKYEAKLEIMNEIKMFKIFKVWKGICVRYSKQIQQQSEQIKDNLKIKFDFFSQWKNETIKHKRAQQFHRKKTYRLFFMTCSELLQIRLKAIYLQQVLKVNRIPSIINCLKLNSIKQKNKFILPLKKVTFQAFIHKIREVKINQDFKRLANLHNRFRIKKKMWNRWSNLRFFSKKSTDK